MVRIRRKSSRRKASPVGGMSTIGGGAVLVTPRGKVVGSAHIPVSGGGGSSPPPKPKPEPEPEQPEFQGPLPKETTPEQERVFRETGETPEPEVTPFGMTEVERAKVTFGEPRQEIQERGVLFVTPQEAEELKTTRASSFFPVGGSLNEAVSTGILSSGIPQRTSSFGDRGTFEYNRAMVEARQQQIQEFRNIERQFKEEPESFIGEAGVEQEKDSITLTPEFFEERFRDRDFFKEALPKAKQDFFSLSKTDRALLTGGSVVKSLAQSGIFVGEQGGTIYGNLGMQQIKEGERPPLFGRTFKFGGKLADIQTLPSTMPTVSFFESPLGFIREKIESPEFVTTAGASTILLGFGGQGLFRIIKQRGVKEGLIETGTVFSPLAVKPGIYTAQVSPATRFDVKGFKFGEGTIFAGRNVDFPDMKVAGFQRAKGGGGYQVVGFDLPALQIRGGGAFSELGTISGIRGGTISGVAGEGQIRPTLSTIKPRLDIDFIRFPSITDLALTKPPKTSIKTAGAVKETDVGINFLTGRREFFDPKKALSVEKGSGRLVTFEPSIKGKIVDLNKLLSGGESSTSIMGGKVGKPSLKTKQTFTDILPQPIQITKPKTLTSIQKPVILVQMPKPKTSQYEFQGLETMQQFRQKQYQFELLGLDTRQALTQTTRQKTRLTPLLDISQSVIPKLREAQATILGTKTIQRTTQKQKLALKTTTDFGIDIGLKPPRIPRGFGFGFPFLPGLGFRETPKPRKKAKRKLKRQPSLIAAELGIKSKRRARGEKTGLVVRPITV